MMGWKKKSSKGGGVVRGCYWMVSSNANMVSGGGKVLYRCSCSLWVILLLKTKEDDVGD